MIETTCEFCLNPFQARKADINRGNAKFCSKVCFYAFRKSLPKTEKKHNTFCSNCNVTFYCNKYRMEFSKSGLQFCSRLCKDTAQRIGGIKEIQPFHYNNGESVYRNIALRNLPNKCNRCCYNEFPEILQVHHKDENRDNSAIENLEILCPNCHCKNHILKI